MHKNVLFRGCTRPAMFLGVPYVPFFLVAGGLLLLSMYIDMRLLVTIPIAIFILRQMAKRDEMIFRLIGLRLQFKFRARNLEQHGGMWVFTPNHYRDKPPPSA
ncbi:MULTISPECIES: VirB3 family type IV secretion system protein [Stenotrophomonas]|uniref:VirB3 family type IV secretion system protein n=1 Tax=Stenotrophomonas aracearum TaxID=3003272 RepID=A0ABY9Y8S8_9GAMM|nr:MULTISPECIES: VirB3 family type IV secretion system protein [unclassified Stenotrophomonas]WNH47276.1 VirB3 family type IV secretion system protein [Stenotrophomonas sp. A5588]